MKEKSNGTKIYVEIAPIREKTEQNERLKTYRESLKNKLGGVRSCMDEWSKTVVR